MAAPVFVNAFFLGGRFDAYDATWTGYTLMGLVAGLPAYVLVKVLTPGFFARQDTKTPVKVAAIALGINLVLNILLIGPFRIAGLAMATALTGWINAGMLLWLLHRKGHLSLDARLKRRALRILGAALAMAAGVFAVLPWAAPLSVAGVGGRVLACLLVAGVGMAIYFTLAILLDAVERNDLKRLLRRKDQAADGSGQG